MYPSHHMSAVQSNIYFTIANHVGKILFVKYCHKMCICAHVGASLQCIAGQFTMFKMCTEWSLTLEGFHGWTLDIKNILVYGLLVYLHDQTGYTTNNCLVSCRISSWWTPMIKSKTSSFCTFTHQTFHRGHFLCMVHNNIVLPVSLSWSLMQRLWWLQMMMRSDCIYLYFVGRDRRPPSEIGLK